MNNFEKHMDELIVLLAEAQDTCTHIWRMRTGNEWYCPAHMKQPSLERTSICNECERLNKQWLKAVI